MCHLMYTKSNLGDGGDFLMATKSIKLHPPSRLELIVLPSAFHKEDYNILKVHKVHATMADRSYAISPIHF